MRAFLTACFMLALSALTAPAHAQETPFRPVAVVNDSAITGYDLVQRAQIMVILGFPDDNPDALRAAALDQLVEDRLKIQAGRAIGILPTEEGYQAGLAAFAEQIGTTPEGFVTRMSAQGVSEQAIRDLIQAEIVWRQVVQARFAGRLSVGEGEIDAELELIGQSTASAWRLAEIGLPLTEGGRGPAETRALANQLYADLSNGGSFEAAARRFSRAPSAARGGDIGWITQRQMPPELFTAIRALGPGEVAAPIEVPGGITIIKVLDTRTQSGANVDPNDPQLREDIRNRIVDQRTQRLAEGFLQELRRDALIQIR